jgi:mono/diheme cytochrome c family protein
MKALLLCTTLVMSGFAADAAEVASPGAKVYGNAASGQAVVGMWCASCHASGTTLNDRIPTLSALAQKLSRSEGAIRTFLVQPHKPMPPLELSTQQIEDIIAYLRTMRIEPAR